VQIPELFTQPSVFQQSATPTSNAHKPPKTVAPTVLMLYAHKPPKTVTPTVLMLDFRPQTAQNCGSYSFDARSPQTAQNCGSYSFDARIKILSEMYCSHQYLSIDTKKKFATPTLTPTNRPSL